MIGPARIDPAQAPGGIVIHVYASDGARDHLVVERLIPGDWRARDAAYLEMVAGEDADAATDLIRDAPAEVGLVLVAYDGDSGERWPNLGAVVQPPEH